MLRSLLAERYKLTFHNERRETTIYQIVVGKKGPKLKLRKPDDGGEPSNIRDVGNGHLICRDTSIARLAAFLTSTPIIGRPVIDHTGLTGTYDFDLRQDLQSSAQEMRDQQNRLTDLMRAFEDLGLKLQAAKDKAEFLIIDHVEKPSEN